MTEKQAKLCRSCLIEKDANGICPACKTSEGISNPAPYLPVGTKLGNRYELGRLVDFNGEGATYIGYDPVYDRRVLVREYLPEGICHRQGTAVVADAGNDANYKAFLSDFCDLAKMIRRLDHVECLVKLLDIIEENNTCYAVYQSIEGIRLDQLLKRSKGRISYERVLPLFLPLLYALREIHSLGFLHRGISLRTLYVEKSTGQLKLFGYGIPAARTTSSGLTPELFNGFAAPEQYDASLWQGTWTDVYAVAGVLYTVLTGVRPENAMNRLTHDNVSKTALLAVGVPEEAAQVILRALELPQERRIATVDPLLAGLAEVRKDDLGEEKTMMFEGASAGGTARTAGRVHADNRADLQRTQVQPVSPAVRQAAPRPRERAPIPDETTVMQARRPRAAAPQRPAPAQPPAPKRRKRKKKSGMPGIAVWFISLVISLIILGSLSMMLASALFGPNGMLASGGGSEASSQAVSSGSGSSSAAALQDPVTVPDFRGKRAEDVVADAQYSGVFEFSIIEEENVIYQEGTIFDQTPVAQTQVEKGAQIVLRVSEETEPEVMPNLVGQTLEEATPVLNEMGILYNTMPIYDSDLPQGQIARTTPEAGEEVTPGVPNAVTLFISSGSQSSSGSSGGHNSGGIWNW